MMTEQEPQTLRISTMDLQPGDVFDRHGKTWTVKTSGTWGPYGSVCVDAEEGQVFLSRDIKIDVRRITGE